MTDVLSVLVNRKRVNSPIYYLTSVPASLWLVAIASWGLEPVTFVEVISVCVSAFIIGGMVGDLTYRKGYILRFGGASADD